MWFLGEFSAGWAGEVRLSQGRLLANSGLLGWVCFSPKVLSNPAGIQLFHYGVKDRQVQILGV